MKLAYAILADAAEVSPNGKLTLMGGNIGSFNTPSFPAVQSRLSLAVNLLVEPSDDPSNTDSSQENNGSAAAPKFRIECLEPDNTTLIFAAEVPVPIEDILKRPQPTKNFLYVINFPPLLIRIPGVYTFRLYWDDQPLDDLLVLARQVELE